MRGGSPWREVHISFVSFLAGAGQGWRWERALLPRKARGEPNRLPFLGELTLLLGSVVCILL